MNNIIQALLSYLRTVYPNYNNQSLPSDFRQIEARPAAYIGANLGKHRYPAIFIEPDREVVSTGVRGGGATAQYTVVVNVIDCSIESNDLIVGTGNRKSVAQLHNDIFTWLGKNKKLDGTCTGFSLPVQTTYANFAVDSARYGLAAVSRITYENRTLDWSGPENNQE